MKAPHDAEKLLFNAMKNKFDEQLTQFRRLESRINSYNGAGKISDIDHIFQSACSLRNNRLDFALYKLAVHSKRGSSTHSLKRAKKEALKEVKHSISLLKCGRSAWKI